jgi:phage terminase small subunit
MPALKDPKHEAFAQQLARGLNQTDAYTAAGYKAKLASAKVNASRLLTNANIQARVSELQAKGAEKAIASVSFEAKDIFQRMEDLIKRAAEAGDYKAAMDGMKFVARCFGYEDSPTLTHEHVKGQAIQAPDRKPDENEGEKREELRDSVVKNFAEELKKLRRRTG